MAPYIARKCEQTLSDFFISWIIFEFDIEEFMFVLDKFKACLLVSPILRHPVHRNYPPLAKILRTPLRDETIFCAKDWKNRLNNVQISRHYLSTTIFYITLCFEITVC